MKSNYDVIVIGSGFGGAVMSCRLSEKGYKVCLLERGREYGMYDFPRRTKEIKERFFWDPKDRQYGIMELRDYPESDCMSVSASGLGGGSLIYANVLMRMPEEFFDSWPKAINRKTLDPFYDKALEMLEASPYPIDKDPYYADTPKTKLFEKVSKELEQDDQMTKKPEYIYPDLAIRFTGDFPGQQMKNKQGAIQSKCTKCGECDIGCNIHAKNTLDLNYIYRARNKNNRTGEEAKVITNALAYEIMPLETGGYRVGYYDPDHKSIRYQITAKKVILSAGSIGSTGLLLRMQKEGILNNLSPKLGKGWCGNGDLEGTAIYSKHEIEPTKGPVITGAIRYHYKDYPDGFKHGAFIQDAGFPIGLAWYLIGKMPSPKSFFALLPIGWKLFWDYIQKKLKIHKGLDEINLGDDFIKALDGDKFTRNGFMFLGMGRDRNDGEIQLREDDEPIIKWTMEKSQLHYKRVRDQMKELSKKMDASFLDNPLTGIDKIIAVHPIGGCCMGESKEDGVVATNGEVFGHPDLFVADASVIPTSVGPNPSLTIAAISEYFADQL